MLGIAAGVLLIQTWIILIPAAVWALANSLAIWSTDSHMFPWLSPFAYAARYSLPIALGLLICCVQSRTELALWVLRISLGITFIAHGLEAFLHYPVFVDYILGAGNYSLGLKITESTATSILTIIGVVDILVAVLFVAVRAPWCAAYMAFWGLVTALSRIVHFGWESWSEVFIRMSHVGVPVVLFLYWRMLPAEEKQAA